MKLCLHCGFLTRNPDRVCDDCWNESDKRFRVKAREIRKTLNKKAMREKETGD